LAITGGPYKHTRRRRVPRSRVQLVCLNFCMISHTGPRKSAPPTAQAVSRPPSQIKGTFRLLSTALPTVFCLRHCWRTAGVLSGLSQPSPEPCNGNNEARIRPPTTRQNGLPVRSNRSGRIKRCCPSG
jgi:hypothetical protein